IFFYQRCISFSHLYVIAIVRKTLQRIQISIQFVIQTTLQSAALTAEFCLIDGKILITGRRCIYRFEICQPCAATKFTATAANATYLCTFLSCTDLAHFHLQLKLRSIYFYQLTKINPAIGDIKECCLATISLHFDLAYFHIKLKLFGNSTAADNCFFLTTLAMPPCINITVACTSQHFFHFRVIFLYLMFFHLQSNDLTCQRYFAKIKTT